MLFTEAVSESENNSLIFRSLLGRKAVFAQQQYCITCNHSAFLTSFQSNVTLWRSKMSPVLKIFLKHINKSSNTLLQKVSSYDSSTRNSSLFLVFWFIKHWHNSKLTMKDSSVVLCTVTIYLTIQYCI